MRFQKQGPRECFPTSIAMVLGMPKDELIARVMPPAISLSWGEWMMSAPSKRALCALYTGIAQQFAPWLLPALEQVYIDGRSDCTPRMLLNLVKSNASGVILIHFLWNGHAVAFGDGLIYDPDGDEPTPPLDWITRYYNAILATFPAIATP